MNVRQLNAPLFLLPRVHPARQFLEALIECRMNCVGRELDDPPIDQAWFSELEQKRWMFSSFAYAVLSFDIELDGWLSNAPHMTEFERRHLEALPTLSTLLGECRAQAQKDDNAAVLPLLAQVIHLVELWERCILSRTLKFGSI